MILINLFLVQMTLAPWPFPCHHGILVDGAPGGWRQWRWHLGSTHNASIICAIHWEGLSRAGPPPSPQPHFPPAWVKNWEGSSLPSLSFLTSSSSMWSIWRCFLWDLLAEIEERGILTFSSVHPRASFTCNLSSSIVGWVGMKNVLQHHILELNMCTNITFN